MLRFPFQSNPQPDPYGPMRLAIFEESLRQARYSFNVSLVAIALSLGISAVGATLLLRGTISEGTVTTASSLLVTGACTQLAKDAAGRLDRLSQDLKLLQEGEG